MKNDPRLLSASWRQRTGFDSVYTKPVWEAPRIHEVKEKPENVHMKFARHK